MVYIFLANGFETMEALAPADVMRRAGVETATVGVTGKTAVSAQGIPVVCDILLNEVSEEKAEMLVLPGGGKGTENLRASDELCALVTRAFERELPVGAICAAPSILASLGLLSGRKVACYPSFEAEIKAAGGIIDENSPCVTDGFMITGQGAGCSLRFALKLLEHLRGAAAARAVADAMLCP